jgi:N6-adenosine-specific RNA methylase IME4
MTPLPKKKYQVIYADPPWTYRDKRLKPGPKGNFAGSAARHYPTMTIEQVCELPVGTIADDPSLLFLWVTWPLMPQWNTVITAWGFKYKTLAFDWIKVTRDGHPRIGGGAYTRSNGEVCLLAVKGRGASLITDHSIVNVHLAPRTRHSEKPHLFRDLIVQLVGDRPRIELFARQTTPGWDVWGEEV